ncbi:HdeD family acid-resistance protein [Haloprofundus sp. MHR1]|uniref:HdeD family acid-resistance protein n=1 Tax=Haloprofundus sp. MHR1 TaxID=2572921 RepID=UPI001C2B94BB|nr:HdeD family acid-resistance protein [Haloprofundus sp. MHR1]
MSTEETSSMQMNGPVADVSATWRTLAVVGGIVAVMGVVAILAPFVTGVALSMLLGALLVVGAALRGIHAFGAESWAGALLQGALAILYTVAGVALIANPVYGLVSLTILLIAYFLVDGLLEVAMGLRLRPEANWGWVVASGVLGLIVAALLFVGFPSTALWAVGLLFGVNLLASGVSMVMVAMDGRSHAREERTAAAARSA